MTPNQKRKRPASNRGPCSSKGTATFSDGSTQLGKRSVADKVREVRIPALAMMYVQLCGQLHGAIHDVI